MTTSMFQASHYSSDADDPADGSKIGVLGGGAPGPCGCVHKGLGFFGVPGRWVQMVIEP